MRLEDAYSIFKEIERSVGKLKDRTGYLPDEFDYNTDDLEERYEHDMALVALNKLGDVVSILEWINKPVKREGYLTKNPSTGRYEFEGTDIYFTSGEPLDVWDEDWESWHHSRVEHSNGDYYIVALGKEKPIEGVKVRVR